jgi:hypothetical protein
MRDIKPNSITHLCCMTTGDRFYCWSDKTKKVYTLKMHTMIMIRGQFKKFSVCVDDKGKQIRFDANRVVMFLRRTKPVRKRNYEFNIDKYFA